MVLDLTGCVWVNPTGAEAVGTGDTVDVTCPPSSQVTELLDVSMELGCFLAGALISSQGHMVTEEIVSYIEPIRDFLAIIFFASIGNFLLYIGMFELCLLNTCRLPL